jgi:hypothetical protein
MEDERKPIGAYCLSNSTSLNVYEIDNGFSDKILVGINDEEPVWKDIHYDCDGSEESRPYFKYGEMKFYLDEFVRV